MVRPRHLLLGMTLAMMLAVSGPAGATEPVGNPDTMSTEATTESVASLLSGSTITCSAALPSGTTACWWEKRILTLGDFEVAIAVDAAVTFSTGEWYVSPMLSLAWYGPAASVWGEVALPADALGIPRLGRSDYVRAGFSYSIP